MSKPAANKISIQITIHKKVNEDINGIVTAINESRIGTELPKVTRSDFIETLVEAFIASHVILKEEAEKEAKEENENA